MPFMPESAEKIFDQIGACQGCRTWEKANVWGSLRPDATVHKGEALFPRIDAEKALAELEELEAQQRKAALPGAGGGALHGGEGGLRHLLQVRSAGGEDQELRAGEKERQAAEVHAGRRLRHGPGQSSPASGTYYEPEQLIGKTAVAILNLPPRKMMGIPSCGMLISAVHKEQGEEKLHLLLLDDAIPAGAKLC